MAKPIGVVFTLVPATHGVGATNVQGGLVKLASQAQLMGQLIVGPLVSDPSTHVLLQNLFSRRSIPQLVQCLGQQGANGREGIASAQLLHAVHQALHLLGLTGPREQFPATTVEFPVVGGQGIWRRAIR